MLDYDFLDKCTDPDLIRAIARKLKSGEEGHYPDLVKVRGTNRIAALLADRPRATNSLGELAMLNKQKYVVVSPTHNCLDSFL